MAEPFSSDDILEFVDEARERIVSLNRDLLELEEHGAGADPEFINSAFRAIHTIKGLSGMLGFGPINRLSHGMEDVLASVREGEVVVSGALAEELFGSLDVLGEMVEAVGRGETEPRDIEGILQKLSAAADEVVSAEGMATHESLDAEEEESDAGDPQTRAPTDNGNVNGQARPTGPQTSDVSQAIRVDVGKLDHILALVGELIIVRSRYNHLAGQAIRELAKATGTSHEVITLQSEVNEVESSMSRTLNELQDAVMKARLVPLDLVFGKFRRAVRDLAARAGKRIRLESYGGETELDKKIIDQIGDPLMHLIRNAVDHGIEPVEERRAGGKSAEGRIVLCARQEGDRIVLEVSDDGRGLDRQRIVETALQRGMLAPERAEEATDREIQQIIATPGFSTSREVTDVSGRGVGMDVVQEALASLKGTLEIESVPGRGSTFRIKLPLTMAIVDALVVAVGGESYAIAVSSVKEILEVDEASVYCVAGQECFHTSGRVIPLVRLVQALGSHRRSAPQDSTARFQHNAMQTTVIVDSNDGEVGLAVDRVIGQQEIVIKALSQRFEDVVEISGGSVLGDGSVCLILDVPSLISQAKGVSAEVLELSA